MDREQLCREVERVTGRRMEASDDFVWLSGQISSRMQKAVSVNTLKRFWGYFEGGGKNHEVKPRTSTLDALAQFVGYRDYKMLCRGCEVQDEDSHRILSRHVNTRTLVPGQLVVFHWLPDRRMKVEHQGKGCFIVVEVENSKLSVGDTFECPLIIENEPLFLGNLIHEGHRPVAYVAGKIDGIRFELVEE